MATKRTSVLLLTGRPGVGKTTVVRRVAEALDEPLSGFYTEEIREQSQRRGFQAVTLDGKTSTIADVDRRGPPRVGKYGVDIAAIDRLAATLRPRPGVLVYVVDEIGKMECLSPRFVETTQLLLDSGQRVVATVGQTGSGLIAEVKRRPDAELWEVTRENRDAMPGRVLAWVLEPEEPRAPRAP